MTGFRPQILGAVAALAVLAGCEVDSYFDPSKTGRFEYTPTTIPILERIDVIEREQDPFADAGLPTQDDLLPGDLTYRIAPGDFITVEIFELLVQSQVWGATRRVSATGMFRLPAPIGDVPAAGLTPQEFQDELTRIVDERVIPDPMVNVTVEETGGFTFTVYGAVAGTGLYALRRADFRILDAIAQAGGVPLTTNRIFVIRQVPLTSDAVFQPARDSAPTPRDSGPGSPVDIEDLIRQLEEGPGDSGPPPVTPQQPQPDTPQSTPETSSEEPPIDIEDLIRRMDEGDPDPGNGTDVDVMPGLYGQASGPPIDIDDLELPPPPPARSTDRQPSETTPPSTSGQPSGPPARPSLVTPSSPTDTESFIYVKETDEWVRLEHDMPEAAAGTTPPAGARMFIERIIEIPYQSLKQGNSQYNIVIRPNDRIYVEEPLFGVVYIDGEIVRPGVYNFPASGRMTLSRLVAAAGGPGPLSMPNRVDLTRMVGPSREATIRLNLGAIRNRTEPDVYLQPDDHIIIGTSWVATPLAVFRNGLRITYGFGFLLDRNFGNDVFGAPPVNRGGF